MSETITILTVEPFGPLEPSYRKNENIVRLLENALTLVQEVVILAENVRNVIQQKYGAYLKKAKDLPPKIECTCPIRFKAKELIGTKSEPSTAVSTQGQQKSVAGAEQPAATSPEIVEAEESQKTEPSNIKTETSPDKPSAEIPAEPKDSGEPTKNKQAIPVCAVYSEVSKTLECSCKDTVNKTPERKSDLPEITKVTPGTKSPENLPNDEGKAPVADTSKKDTPTEETPLEPKDNEVKPSETSPSDKGTKVEASQESTQSSGPKTDMPPPEST